jgi:hypothetical protein
MVRLLFVYLYCFLKKRNFKIFFFNPFFKHKVNYSDKMCSNCYMFENIQVHLSQTIKKFDKEKKKLQDKNQLYNDLQEKYNGLTNKYHEEKNQHQIIVKNLKSDIKGIEDKYLKNIQQLESQIKQINDVNQQYQSKINLQEQQIDQLQQSLELKENQLQIIEEENDNLHQKHNNLINQLINDIGDEVDQNCDANLNNDISKLNDNLKKYITDCKQDIIVNIEEIKRLLLYYKCQIKITNQKDDLLLIQAVLQRHIIETTISYAGKYFQSTGQHHHLESDIINNASSLSKLLIDASKHRTGNDEITRVTLSTLSALRKQIYLILNDRGFADICGKGNNTYEHPFITFCKEKLNKTMNELRIIKDQGKIIAVESFAAAIIRDVIKIFWFRLKVHGDALNYTWIPYNVKVVETLMERENFDDNDNNENLYVDFCYFPLIGRDLKSNNSKVYIPAKVFVRKKSTNSTKLKKI